MMRRWALLLLCLLTALTRVLFSFLLLTRKVMTEDHARGVNRGRRTRSRRVHLLLLFLILILAHARVLLFV